MSKEASFDIVSKVDMAAMQDALHQAVKEIETRFDLKGTGCELALEAEVVTAKAPDDFKLRNIVEILEARMVKRGLSLKALEQGKVESSLGGALKQAITVRQGIDKERAKKIIGIIKDLKLKVQTQIQDDQVRVTGKNKDDLQLIIAALRKADLDIDLQYLNFR